jgi:hypothetical protein
MPTLVRYTGISRDIHVLHDYFGDIFGHGLHLTVVNVFNYCSYKFITAQVIELLILQDMEFEPCFFVYSIKYSPYIKIF